MIINIFTNIKKLFSKEEINTAQPTKPPKPPLEEHHPHYKDLGEALQEMPDQVYKEILLDGSHILHAITGEPIPKKKKKPGSN